jgi:uncharacterized protein YecE (DUF72 family)
MLVRVGTSGYNYTEWRGRFYPEAYPAKSMFGYYAARFPTVEINYTFYRMPTPATTAGWLAQAPPGFEYTLKAPQRITHFQRLQNASESLAAFGDSARVLGPHLGALLFQLPPQFKVDVSRLEAFLAQMPPGVRPAFEFRHDSWLNDEVYAVLAAKQAALVVADFGNRTTPLRPTAAHGYLRLRDEGYTRRDLERWADRLIAEGGAWSDVFVYFKHEDAGKGPEFALGFVEILEARGVHVRRPPPES